VDAVELTSLVAPGHRSALVRGLAPLSEGERRKLWPTVKDWAGGYGERFDPNSLAIAIVGTAGGVRQAASGLQWVYRADDFETAAVQVLADRAPAWLPDLPTAILREGISGWHLVRQLVLRGLVERPEEPDYYVSMVNALRWRGMRDRSVLDQLRRDPGLLEHELWQMLATELSGRRLATGDSWDDKPPRAPHPQAAAPRPHLTWRHALATLAADETIDRGRLLDAALAAPLRDWAAADLGWFVTLHDALEPTLDEVAQRQGTYGRLLAVEHGPAVKAAQKQLTRLVNDPRLDTAALLASSRATLTRPDKASVAAQLRLLAQLAKADGTLPVAEVASLALEHPRADVREQAGKLLGMLGESVAPASTRPVFEAPDPSPRPRPGRVDPVEDADELGDLILRLLEEADDPMQLERLVDGLLRLADERPPQVAVVERRLEDAQLYLGDVRVALATLARVWLTPRKRLGGPGVGISLAHAHFGSSPASESTLLGVAGRRLIEVGQSVRSGATIGLARPSYDDGSIDPADLSARLAGLGRRNHTPAGEAALAVLRVDPARLGEVVVPRSAGACGRAVADAVRRVTAYEPEWQREVRQLPPPYRWQKVGPRLATFTDLASCPTGHSRVDTLLTRADPWSTAPHELEFGEYEPRFEQTLAFCALLLPHHPDVLAAHLHPLLHRDLGKERGVCAGVHDALARSRVRTGAPTASALVLGLAAKDARARTAAQDALIELCRHGLLDGAELGRQAAAHLADGLVVGQRVSTGLAEVARADAAAVLPVLAALKHVLPGLPGRRDAGVFLALTADLAELTGRKVPLPAELATFAAGNGTSQMARAARRLA
jgi:hypothetical protein